MNFTNGTLSTESVKDDLAGDGILQQSPELFKPSNNSVRFFDKTQCRIGGNTHIINILANQFIMMSGKCGAYPAGSIETDRLVMGYAVAELPYLNQFAVNVTLRHPMCLVREYAQQCFLPDTVVATCKNLKVWSIRLKCLFLLC